MTLARGGPFTRLAAWHDAVTRAGAVIGAGALGLMVAAYVFEVVARYFLSAPTSWATESVNYLLCAMIFLLAPELTRQRKHIAITFILERMPIRTRTASDRTFAVIGCATCVAATLVSLDSNIQQYLENVVTQAAQPIPKWTVSAFITYGFANAALHFLRQAFARAPESSQAIVDRSA